MSNTRRIGIASWWGWLVIILSVVAVAVVTGVSAGIIGNDTGTVKIRKVSITSSVPIPTITAATPIATMTATPTQPQPLVTDPWAVVSAYYGDIESGDYLGAWSLLSISFQDSYTGGDYGNYQEWVNGYADTGAEELTDLGESGDMVQIKLAAFDTAANFYQYFTGWYMVSDGFITSGSIMLTGIGTTE